jgi:hypothetical protein
VGRAVATAAAAARTTKTEDELERKVNSGLMSARAPPKVTPAASRDRSANANAATPKNIGPSSLPKKVENEENNGKVSRGGGGAALVGTTHEDGAAAGKISSSKPEAGIAVQATPATVERSAQGKAAGGKNSMRANFNWSDEVDDHNNDISGGGKKGNNASVNGKINRGGVHNGRGGAGSGSKANGGGNVIAPTAVNTANDTNTKTANSATPTTVVVPNPLSDPSIVRSPQPPINVNVDNDGDAVPQNIHARARNRRSNSNNSTAVVPNPLSIDPAPPTNIPATTIINSTTTEEKKTKKKKIRPKLTPSMDDLTASVEDDDYALWTAPSPLPPSPPPTSTKNESDNPMQFSSASLGPSPAKLKKGITKELFLNGGEDSIMSMNSSMDDGTTLSVASSSKASAAKQKGKKNKKKMDTSSSSSRKQPSTSTSTTTADKSTQVSKNKVKNISIDTTITTTSSNESSPITMIISPCLSENSIAIRQKATQLLLRQPSERRSSSISTSTEDRNEKSKSFLTQISSENEIVSPTLMDKKVLVDVSNRQEKEDVKEEEEVVVVEEWPPQGKTNKDECCSMCVLS